MNVCQPKIIIMIFGWQTIKLTQGYLRYIVGNASIVKINDRKILAAFVIGQG